MKTEIYTPPAERDAQAIREARRQLRNSQSIDPLRERMQVVKFWKNCEKTNPLYCGPHSRALYRNTGFQRYLMPRLAAMLKAQKLARRQAYTEACRLECEAAQRKKALKNAPPLSLFPEAV